MDTLTEVMQMMWVDLGRLLALVQPYFDAWLHAASGLWDQFTDMLVPYEDWLLYGGGGGFFFFFAWSTTQPVDGAYHAQLSTAG
ncbi:MAG: hypothetical protein JJ921_18985 [Pseudomonadales bacterium]|nr:hypothetical protein [Pseudomonadales bacterium]MBO7007953.1 hypothetical protein [Pseudomonadales bacterium]